MINALFSAMIDYFSPDAKRIQHFTKVYAFARLIGEREKVDERTMFIIKAAALTHDIGIKPAEAKYGSCSGKLQEKEGPAEAEKLLTALGFTDEVIRRVCFLIANHHTCNDIKDIDLQILVEADFLVNLYEDNLPVQSAEAAYKNIFKTETGKEICAAMFGLNKS